MAHEQEIARWREARLARLLSPDSWLTLVDRIVLAEGDNELPIGTITLADGQARFRARPGVDVTCGGQPVAERLLRSDEHGPPDTLLAGGRSYELYRRGDAFAVRVKDPQAETRTRFHGLDYFPVDPAWRIVARFERFDPPRQAFYSLDIGGGWQRPVPGLVHFTVGGHAVEMEPVLEESARRLFFVFSDATSGAETYGGGRFLYAPLPADGADEVVLDFNMAFNPPCVFTLYATCPVPPARNRLPIAVRAGERRYNP